MPYSRLARVVRGASLRRKLLAGAVWLVAQAGFAQSSLEVTPLSEAQLWRRLEFRLSGVPAATNPFDPDVIRVEGTFKLPSNKTLTVPAYWHQSYSRSLSGGREALAVVGEAEWRLRYAPPEAGDYTLTISVFTNGVAWGEPATRSFTVPTNAPSRTGYARVGVDQQYLVTDDGQALPLIGANVCWHGARGTYDYDEWFAAMRDAGANYARLWMWPSSFGLETAPDSLNRYRLDRAWQLDYVLQLAEQRGIYVELCLDYHGMFAVDPDYWGGNNYWPSNPYCVTNGGPCSNPNAFFTTAAAKAIYQKRLRYLVARYGYSPNLLSWQFFNEIDNVSALLTASDVARWHAEMGAWLRAHDPFGHLQTTSFTYAEPHPEIWALPQMDYVCVHSYGAARPAATFASTVKTLSRKYGKPVLIDEFGTSWQGWNRSADPYLRGLRQGLWGGALSGSLGTGMSWWWENLYSEKVYSVHTALKAILGRTGWGHGAWTNIGFQASLTPPATVSDLLSNGEPFSVTLAPATGWGTMVAGKLAVPNAAAQGYAASLLNAFVHGTSHADLKTPFQLSAWFTNNARLVMHLNSVSWNPILVVRSDGAELYRTNLANLDGGYSVTNEYNVDLPVNLPVGRHLIEIVNAGADWFYLDWVRLEQVLPASYSDNWQAPCEPIGLSGAREALVYVVAPGAAFPAGATNAVLPTQTGRSIVLTNWAAGKFLVEWYEPASGQFIGYDSAVSSNSVLTLELPDFAEDLAGLLYQPPTLTPRAREPQGAFQFRLDSETGGRYWIEASSNLTEWFEVGLYTNLTGMTVVTDSSGGLPSKFYRAKQQR